MPAPQKHFSLLAKIFHWGVMAVFIYGIAKQVGEVSDLHNRALLIFEMKFAAAFLALLAVRYLYMTKTQTTSLPNDTPRWQKRMAFFAHQAMYISLAAIAITGLGIGLLFMMGFTEGMMISAVVELHGITVTVSYALIALHVSAALFHRFQEDGVWSSMVPFFLKEK